VQRGRAPGARAHRLRDQVLSRRDLWLVLLPLLLGAAAGLAAGLLAWGLDSGATWRGSMTDAYPYAELANLTARAEKAEAERDLALAGCAAMREALERATEAAMLVHGLYDHNAALRAERDALKMDYKRMIDEAEALRSRVAELERERDSAWARWKKERASEDVVRARLTAMECDLSEDVVREIHSLKAKVAELEEFKRGALLTFEMHDAQKAVDRDRMDSLIGENAYVQRESNHALARVEALEGALRRLHDRGNKGCQGCKFDDEDGDGSCDSAVAPKCYDEARALLAEKEEE
jgi:hypothetical protein